MLKYLLSACLCLGLCACAKETPSPIVDLDEYVFQQAIKVCYDRTQAMTSDSPELFRVNYFEHCMSGYGYEPSSYKHLWLNI
jgi:hypothetical protein